MFKHHEQMKYLHAWMSFSSHEADLLQSYLNEKAEEGYEVRKIARFYIRFKHTSKKIPPFYVQSFRPRFFGHLYWKFGHEPFEKVQEKSRLRLNLSMLFLMAFIFTFSIYGLMHFNYHILYSDGFFALALLMPFFAASFFLDYLGRCFESYRPKHHGYQFAHFRALYLSINMFLRYLLSLGIILPLFLKELRIQVVFIILFVSIYELAYYYLPHRFSKRMLAASGAISLLICMLLNQVEAHMPYRKSEVDYSSFEVLRLENMVRKDDFDDTLNYKRQVHRYTSTSLMVPLYFYREETMQPTDASDIYYEVSVAFSCCKTKDVAKYLLDEKTKEGKQLDATKWQVDEVWQINENHVVVLLEEMVYEFSGTFDFSSPENSQKMNQMIKDNLIILKKN